MNKLDSFSTKVLHGLFFVLLLLSIFLYKERLFVDASYYFFHAINSGWFHVEHGRTVLAFSQVLPILGTYLGLPLKIVMILASLGHELFYYSIFLLCLIPLKDKASATAVLAIHVIGQLWLYYSPMLEICYGAALAVLFYSILNSGSYKKDIWLILIIIVQWFTMMSHPENFLLIAVAIAYHYANKGFKFIQVKLAILLIIGFLVELLTFSEYESGHARLNDGDLQAGVGNLLDATYLGDVVSVFTGHYFDLLILFVVAIAVLIKQKKGKHLFILIGSVLFLIAIVNQAATANKFTRYYESMYNPLVFIVVLFFCNEVLNAKNTLVRNIGTVGLILIIGFRIYWIVDFGKPLQQRVTQIERVVDYAQNLGHSKYIINEKNIEREYSEFNWGFPIETLLYSAADGKEQTISIAGTRDLGYKTNKADLTDSTFMFRRFEIHEHSFLNQNYFQLQNDEYHLLNSTKKGSDFKGKMQVEPYNWSRLEKNDTVFVPFKVVNTAKTKIPSNSENPILLSYHWLKEDGSVLEWDGPRTPLEVDLFNEHVQDIQIITPAYKGSFILVPDAVIEGELWFDLKEQYPVRVN